MSSDDEMVTKLTNKLAIDTFLILRLFKQRNKTFFSNTDDLY